jgi:hypothetical protein
LQDAVSSLLADKLSIEATLDLPPATEHRVFC